MTPDSGWVYAAQEDGTPLVKIGYTRHRNPIQRIKSLRHQFHVSISLLGAVWLPSALCATERAIHAHLASSRIEGEWFYLHIDQTLLESLVQEVSPLVLAKFPYWYEREKRIFARYITKRLGEREYGPVISA